MSTSSGSSSVHEYLLQDGKRQIKLIKFTSAAIQVLMFCLIYLSGDDALRREGVAVGIGHVLGLSMISLIVCAIFHLLLAVPRLKAVRKQYGL